MYAKDAYGYPMDGMGGQRLKYKKVKSMYGRKKKRKVKKYKTRKTGGSMVSVLFKKGTSRWRKYFKSKASASRAKRGLKSVGWYC
jgi:hypothetical protein